MEWRDELGNNKSTRQWFSFIIVATILEQLLCIALLINTCKPCFNRKIHAFLIALLLMLEFAIAVVIATLTSQLSIAIDILEENPCKTVSNIVINYNGYLDTPYHLGIADSVISFVLKFPLLLIALWTALDNLGHFGIGVAHPAPIQAPVTQAPPLSANRLN